jgi:hypothetical protein
MPELKLVMYYIDVNASGTKAHVRLIPPVARLEKNVHTVCFASNNPRAAIRFDGNGSPFAEAEVASGQILDVGNIGSKGPYAYIGDGQYHFDCGFRNELETGGFSNWGGGGADPPQD